MDLNLTIMLLIVSVLNGLAYYLFIRVVNKYLDGSLTEERRQLNIVFTVFLVVVTSVMIVFSAIGFISHAIIKNITMRWFLENMFSIYQDFPILLILYFHHINFKKDFFTAAQLNRKEPGENQSSLLETAVNTV